MASALSRMWAYEQAYGFTQLRLLVSAFELWLGVVFLLVIVAGATGGMSAEPGRRAAWLPSAVLGTGIAALIALAALNPDRFIADQNVTRYEETGRIDLDYLSSISADAVPALYRLPAELQPCVLGHIARDLTANGPDSWNEWNLGRAEARRLLADYEPSVYRRAVARVPESQHGRPVTRARTPGAPPYRGRAVPADATVETVVDESHAGQPPALALRGLVKRFGPKVAVAGVDLDVPPGSFYGLLGPNGAGKTTTLSMAVGLLRPDAGAAFVLGHNVWADPVEAKRRLGVLPDGVRMFDRLSGTELLAYTGLLRGMDPREVDNRARDLLDVLGLADAGRTLVVDYSAGMKKKIGLACALLHAPRLLVLDEPFEAVDPVSAALIRDILQRYVHSGGSVIFSSHVMEVVEKLCTHVAILADGAIKAVGTLDEVRAGRDLEDVFVDVVGGRTATGQELSWL